MDQRRLHIPGIEACNSWRSHRCRRQAERRRSRHSDAVTIRVEVNLKVESAGSDLHMSLEEPCQAHPEKRSSNFAEFLRHDLPEPDL